MTDLGWFLLLVAVVWLAAVGLILLFFHGASRLGEPQDRMSERWLHEWTERKRGTSAH